MKESEINIPELNPRAFAYSDLENKKTVYPSGVRPITTELLQDGFETGAFDELSSQQQELISLYFGTNISAKEAVGLSVTSSKRRIIAVLKALREALPQEIRDKYDPKETLKLKTPYSERLGWQHNEKSISKIRKAAKSRVNKGHQFSSVEASIASFEGWINGDRSKRRKKISQTKKRRKQQGYRFSKLKAKEAAMKRWSIEELPLDERLRNPVLGALFTLSYIKGKDFPQELRRFYEDNPKAYVVWAPPMTSIFNLPYIEYRTGKLWYVIHHEDRKDEKIELTEELLRRNPENAKNFGRFPIKEILKALELRMRSISLFSRPLRIGQSQEKP